MSAFPSKFLLSNPSMECIIRPNNALLLDRLFFVPLTIKISEHMEMIYYTNEELRKIVLKEQFFECYNCDAVRIFSIPKTNFYVSKMRCLKLMLINEVLTLEFSFDNSKLTKYLDIMSADNVEIPSSSFYYNISIDLSLFCHTIDIFLYCDRIMVKEKTLTFEKEVAGCITNGCNLMVRIDSKVLRKLNWYRKLMKNFSLGVGENEPINAVFSGDGFIYTYFHAVYTQRI